MRISCKWLSDYVDAPAAEELARLLTGVGLEVEAVERLGAELTGVVAARVVASEKHPNAEKLSVTRIDAGGPDPLQIVCGAKNYQVGDVVPLATIGTVLPGGMRIERAKLRGVESFGMLCSAKELGIDADASGLLILPRDAKPGTPVADVLGLADVVLEVNVTPNRPDALSHVGIAREVAALLGKPLRLPQPKLDERGAPASDAVRVRIEAPDRCARYAARVVEGVRIGPSPGWLARRLEACGVRSISNVVDVTNFVLLELGHPLHAFDLDRVAGHEIVVRTARPGERMTTLDGKERALDPEDLLIADRDRGSALAGVMGGGDSEISAGTTRVLIESAWFSPAGIRRTSRRHQLRSEASFRFERGADPGAVIPALNRCAELLAELAGGAVRPGIVDANPRPFTPGKVRLAWTRPAEVLGAPVELATTRRILGGLGFVEASADEQGATFEVPSWRVDIAHEEDLIEEICRTQGYDAIPERLPAASVEPPAPAPDRVALTRVRDALEAAGFSETVTFSFVSPADVEAVEPGARPIALANPISADLAVMRTSLVGSLLRSVAHDRRQGLDSARVYEIASVYRPRTDGARNPPADERRRICGVLAGRRSPVSWGVSGDPVDFYDAKASVEAVLAAIGVGDSRVEIDRATTWLHPRSAGAVLLADGTRVGALGEIHPRTAAAFSLPRGVFAFELEVGPLVSAMELVAKYRPVPRLPALLRDLAVVVSDRVRAADVLAAVRTEPLVEDVTLFDVYTGPPIPAGKKNLAMAISYRAADRTLTDAEADAAHARILERLRTDPAVAAELRA
ncbi:MAG TPA: phenylalanine--tRNA ligase subunit beta [Anaeromyxobacteraceae bacterium]|nr:phenylalanine--tRNA ligase subunit beta [Anaeromyxobacteraceae bacterium]